MSTAKALCVTIIIVIARHKWRPIIGRFVCSIFSIIGAISLCSVQIVTILVHRFISEFIHIFAKSSDAQVHGRSELKDTLLTQKRLSRINLGTLRSLLLTQTPILSYHRDVFSLG